MCRFRVGEIAGLGLLFLGSSLAQSLPASNEGARQRLNASPRHAEWIEVDTADSGKVKSWIVYPQRSGPAPVVIVIHEIYGLTDWIRAVADQLAAEGFIAVAPDLLSGKGPGGSGTDSVDRDGAVALIRSLDRAEVARRIDAVARHTTGLPAARSQFAVMGFCWGGSTSFAYATHQPELSAAVVYYGTGPAAASLDTIRAPVLGLYGGDDARVTQTVPASADEMKARNKRFEYEIYEGAGHGFLRAQEDRDGANRKASEQAWPRMLRFLKASLGDG